MYAIRSYYVFRNLLRDTIEFSPFAFAMFFVSMFLKSQAAALTIMLPLGFSLGISSDVLLGVLPSCYAYFFFPFYPSDLAAISFDRTSYNFV